MYSHATGLNRTIVLNAQIHIDEVVLEELTQIVRIILNEYLDTESDEFRNGLCGLLGGRLVLSAEDFAERALRASAVSGPEEVADKIIKWSRGGSFQYKHEALLNLRGHVGDEGIIGIEEGIEIEKLPGSSAEASKCIPGLVSFQLGQDDLSSNIVLRIACEWKPVFLGRQEGERQCSPECGQTHWNQGKFPMTWNTVEELCQSMAVTMGRPVSWRFQWRNCQADELFTDGNAPFGKRGEHSKSPQLSVKEEDLIKAWDFHVQREIAKGKIPDVEGAIKRLHRSQQALTLEDQAIELRIALEILFLSRGEGSEELSFRLALRAARYIGVDAADREKWFKVAKYAYRIGSRVIHGGGIKLKDEEKNRQIIAEGQKLCIEGIKKRIKEQRDPDWDKVMLE